jgi:hypothetical protein
MAPALIIRGGGVCPLREKLLAVCCNVSTTTQHHDRLDNDHRILTVLFVRHSLRPDEQIRHSALIGSPPNEGCHSAGKG